MPRAKSVACVVAVLFVCACGYGGEQELEKTSLVLHWSSQAQFAGYYVAQEKGFYRRHGVELELVQGGPQKPSDRVLAEGGAEYASIWLSTALRLWAATNDIVNIGQLVQRSALMLVARSDSGIDSPEDMAGRKIAVWPDAFQLQPRALFRERGIDVKIITTYYPLNLFLDEGVDAASVMWYNEYHSIINAGINKDELNKFFFHEYGLNFPEEGLYTTRERYESSPGLAQAIVDATMQGWHYAFENPDEALEIVLKVMAKEHRRANRAHQAWMLARMKDIMLPGDRVHGPGTLYCGDYERVVEVMKSGGILQHAPNFADFYKGRSAVGEKE